MKKILMLAATTAMLSTTAFADAENMFYVKANVGANWMNKVNTDGIKTKTKAAPIFLLGVGYYAMDNVRADLTIEMISNPVLKGTGTSTTYNTKASVKHKGQVGALMVNGYVDMFDVSVAGIFAGAGVGVARVKTKSSATTDGVTESDSTKNKTNVAYQLTLGAAAEVAPGVKAELAYSWRDYGKTGKYKTTKDAKKIAFRGHNVMAGVKFDL
jgi:opacity protein-like surface antigen